MATFAEALYSLPTDRLRSLAARREIDVRRLNMAADKRQLAQIMATELNKPPSVARAVLQCNARELRLLQLMLSLSTRHTVLWSAVLEAAGGPRLDAPLSDILGGIEALGLAFRVGENVLLSEAVSHQVPTSLSDHYTVSGCLQGYDAPTLRLMAQRLGTGGGTKAENIEAITRRLLFASEGVFGAIPLAPDEQAVLDYIVQSGGAATAIEVASAVLGHTDDFFRYDWQNRWKLGKEKNAIDRLLARGMIYVVSYAYGFNLFLVMPGDLMRAVTGESRATFWTSPAPDPIVLATPPRTARRQTALTRDVVALLAFISTQEAVRTNTGYIHKTILKNLARVISIQDDRYAAFLYAVSRQAGLIAPTTEKHAYAVTPRGQDWLRIGALEQTRWLYLAWRNGDLWGEMYSEPLRKGNEYRSVEGVVSVRQAALSLVTKAPLDRFIDIASLTDVLSYRFPLLLAQSTNLGGDLVASPANFMRLLIGECLAWLGLAELGWYDSMDIAELDSPASASARPQVSSADTAQSARPPNCYRLTPEGAALMDGPGAAAPEETPSETKFVLQANAEIYLPPYLEADILFYLLLIAEMPAKSASGNLVSVTRESVRRALDQGISGGEILAFLRTHARTGIPQNVEYLINEVSEKHGHIHIGRAQMYLQVDSPLVLKELQSRRELKGYFVRTLGDTVAILNAPEPDKLLKELRKAGYLPISDDAPKRAGMKFGVRGVSAVVAAGTPSLSKPTKSAPAIETAVDWQRIAKDDPNAWRDSESSSLPNSRPQDAVQDKSNIRTLLLDAIHSGRQVQIAYQGQGDSAARVRIIDPQRVMGNFVEGYLPLEAEKVTLNINRIPWARIAREVSGPP